MLNDQTFPLTWEETTMNDGKPLIVSIQENNGNLFLHFNKTREVYGRKVQALFVRKAMISKPGSTGSRYGSDRQLTGFCATPWAKEANLP